MAQGTGYKSRTGNPDPVWWMEQIRKGIEFRNKRTYQKSWAQWRKFYRGEYTSGVLPDNVFFKMLRTMIPRVYFRNPSVTISPRRRQQGSIEYYVMAMLLEQVDNALFDRMRLKQTMKKAVMDGFLYGTGVLKLGYGAQFTSTPDLAEPTDAPAGKHGHRVEYHSFVLPDTPWVLRVPTGRFIVPNYALDWPSCRWAAHEELRHVDDVRNDDRLQHVADINAGVLTSSADDATTKLGDQVSLVEVRDKKSGEVFILAPTQRDKVLAQDDDLLQFENRLPFFPIQFNGDDEYFWATPDAKILEPHQVEMNEIRRITRAHRKLSILKWMVREGGVSVDEIMKLLTTDEIGAVVKVDKDAQSFEQVIKEFTAGDIPAGVLKAQEIEDQTIQEILGLGVNQFGEYAPGSSDRSATEAMIVNQATQIRTDERRDVMADTIVDLTEHLNHVVLSQWQGEQLVAIVGPEGQDLWVKFKAQDIKSLEYDVKVDPDSSIPETKAVRLQKTQMLYAAAQQDQNFDKRKIAIRFVQELEGPAGIDLLSQPQQTAAQPGQPGQMGAPGQPGSSPQQPMSAHELIGALAQRAGQKEVVKIMTTLTGKQRQGGGHK